MGWELDDLFRFDLGHLLQGQMRIVKLKSDYNSLIIGPKRFAMLNIIIGNLDWESSDVRFDLVSPSRPSEGSQT